LYKGIYEFIATFAHSSINWCQCKMRAVFTQPHTFQNKSQVGCFRMHAMFLNVAKRTNFKTN